MSTLVQILYLEDDPRDAELVTEHLRAGLACTVQVVDDRSSYATALQHPVDIILSDYKLPAYDGLAALALAQATRPGVPFILLSGTLGEERAVDCILRGANDFVLKQRLERLCPAILRALREAEAQRQRQQAEAALAQSEMRYRRLFEAAQDGILILDYVTGLVVDVNSFLIKLLGYSHDALCGKRVWELGFFKDLVANEAKFHALQVEDSQRYADLALETVDGRRLEVEVVSTVYLVNSHKVIQCNIRDISARVRVEAAQRESERRYRALTQHAPDGVVLVNAQGAMIFASPTARRMFGLGPDDPLPLTPDQLTHPEDLPQVLAALTELLREPTQIKTLQYRYRHQQGDWIWIESIFTNLIGVPGVDAVVINFRNIHERKQAEELIRLNQERLQRSQAVGHVGSWEYDLQTQLIWASTEAFRIFGMAPGSDLISLDAIEARIPEHQRVRQALSELITHGRRYDLVYEVQPADGSPPRMVNSIAELIRDGHGQPAKVHGVIMDISQRVRAAEAHTRLATAVEQAAETIVITDLQGVIQYVNPAFERSTGYTAAEAIGQNPRMLKSGKHELVYYQQLWATLAAGLVWHGHFVNKHKDGTLYNEEATISPIRNAAGQIVNYVAVKRDVTHEMELEAQFRQAQKMEAVGQLAGGVAHDFNNLLAVICGYAELALCDLRPADPLYLQLQEIKAAGDRAATLTRQLLAFSRKQVLTPQVLNLNDVVRNLERMLQRLIGEHIVLTSILADNLAAVQADPSQVEQVLMNLVVNARDAMPQGGTLTIRTSNCDLDDTLARTTAGVPAGQYVVVAVSDTGCGMSPAVLAHVFEPFFTTKEQGKGTGLGLATVFGIVKQSGGHVTVSSQERLGSTFSIYLPQVQATATGMPPPASLAPAPGGCETILLVEDELQVQALATEMLTRSGYQVLGAANGGAALLILERRQESVHLLLTDVVMPNLSGPQLAARLQSVQPGLKVLYMSGYTADAMVQNGLLPRGLRLLNKPFSSDSLLRAVRAALDEA